jgi:hypothetical protein
MHAALSFSHPHGFHNASSIKLGSLRGPILGFLEGWEHGAKLECGELESMHANELRSGGVTVRWRPNGARVRSGPNSPSPSNLHQPIPWSI